MDLAIKKALDFLNYEKLRQNQEDVIKAYLSGKSLTFEVAPFVFKHMDTEKTECTVIVISPLVALMQYQVEGLVKKGVNAVYLQEMDKNSLEDIISGKADIIFASPESVVGAQRTVLTELSRVDALKAIFVDEAHCIKKFGKADKKKKIAAYRPAYTQLGEIRSLVQRNVPIIAMTATADESTRKLIVNTLCMTNPVQIIATPEKPNVKYSVINGQRDIIGNFKWLFNLLEKYGVQCPRIIVFFRQIKHIAEVFEFLQTNLGDKQYCEKTHDKNGYWNRIFAMFHLMTNDKIKKAVCSSFQEPDGYIRVVLCSTSFSMGLDVKLVHTVVHFGPANDLDDYLQESGRAGRNPENKCDAILVKYSYSLSSQNITTNMKNYVKTASCRRVLLLQQFSKDTKPLSTAHDCCDNCAAKCSCLCKCTSKCTCETLCSQSDSEIMNAIKTSISMSSESDDSSSSSNEDFSSDSDIETFIQNRPTIVYSSDSE